MVVLSVTGVKMIKPLAVCMSVRDFPIAWYWLKRACKVNNVDLLVVKYYPHHIAHEKARKFFLKHKEYTHFIIVNEDCIITDAHLRLLLEDIEKYGYDVIGGYVFPYSLRYPTTNLTDKDLSKIRVVSANQYDFWTLEKIITMNMDEPLKKMYFNGLTLTSISRKIIEKIEFKPYKYILDSALGKLMRRGIMFDVQFSNTLRELGIPFYVDLRLMVIHFGNTRKYINLRGKKSYCKLVKPDGKEKLVRV